MTNRIRNTAIFFGLLIACLMAPLLNAQVDQGAITGVVRDETGAVVPNAQLTLTNTDTNLVLQGTSSSSGTYVFSPLKIGNYSLSVTSPGFSTSTQQHLHVDAQSRSNIEMILKPGSTTQEIVVSTEPPLLQSEAASVGQTLSAQTISSTPLNGRNWVYIAQLTAGATPSVSGQSRGGGSGDFFANGQRATQNDFVLDGVDNNINDIDFMNGTSYSVRPPPDALSEFKVETSNYSAEFGHSAGAVLNASIKSGTNQLHGSAWEYVRNTVFDSKDWTATAIPKYNENQFGATLGFPIWRNKLFYFGDLEMNRIVIGVTPSPLTVPTPLMRQGNFSELMNTTLTGQKKAIQLYQPNSNGSALLSCNGQNNVFCPNQISQTALNMLNQYPLPNANGGKTFNNYTTTTRNHSNTIQWDQRLDWNPSSKDQAYARLSYDHVQNNNPTSLGPTIGNGTSHVTILAENTMASETHSFNSSLTNEARFGYNWGAFFNLQQNFDRNVATGLGIGGLPTGPDFPYNGGLPAGAVGGITTFGTGASVPSVEHQNVYQILDNLTKIAGRHSLKIGLDLQSVRMAFLQPPASRGIYNYTGFFTSNPQSADPTGYGVADFLANQMFSGQLSNESTVNDTRWYRSGYFEDDWKISDKLTFNLGLRYDYYQPWVENGDGQANFAVTSSGIGTGTANLYFPKSRTNTYLAPAFRTLMSASGVTLVYTDNRSLVTSQKKNIAPRLGFAFSVTPSTVIRGGYGIFYGGLESFGSVNLGESYPFQYTGGVTSPSCKTTCTSDGITIENGFAAQISSGLVNFVSSPSIQGAQLHYQTGYTMNYNLALEHGFSNSLVGTVSYVGNGSRHLLTLVNPNAPNALVNPANSITNYQPFPLLGRDIASADTGQSNYNGLQAKLQKRLSHGLEFLANYTFSHALDNSVSPIEPNAGQRQYNLIPQSEEYTNSVWDVRQRVTLNGYYAIPFGAGQAHAFSNKLVDLVAGGWAASLTFVAQTGNPFTVTPNNSVVAAGSGGGARTFLARDPFKPGGSPADPTNNIACAPSTHTRTNWYNPCAFINPLPASNIKVSGAGSQVTDKATAITYLGGRSNLVYGPGYNRINMSMFKRFPVFRENYIEFRADAFNLLNHPSWNQPSNLTDNPTGGLITAAKSFQSNTPDARFFQLSGKYVF